MEFKILSDLGRYFGRGEGGGATWKFSASLVTEVQLEVDLRINTTICTI